MKNKYIHLIFKIIFLKKNSAIDLLGYNHFEFYSALKNCKLLVDYYCLHCKQNSEFFISQNIVTNYRYAQHNTYPGIKKSNYFFRYLVEFKNEDYFLIDLQCKNCNQVIRQGFMYVNLKLTKFDEFTIKNFIG